MNLNDFKVSAISNEKWLGAEKGQRIEGFLNSWHKHREYTIQTEYSQEVEGCSGIMVVDVGVDKESIKRLTK